MEYWSDGVLELRKNWSIGLMEDLRIGALDWIVSSCRGEAFYIIGCKKKDLKSQGMLRPYLN